MISVIAFDYGGVIEVSKTNVIKEILDFLNISKDKWSQTYFSLNHLCNTGKNTWGEVILLTAKEVGATEAQLSHIKELINNDAHNKVINEELIAIIRELRKSYKIAIISNYSKELRDRLADQKLLELFDEVIISGEVGYQKPQPEIFAILCERMNVVISELVFIDDTKRSLEGADIIGYTPILYTSNKNLEEALSITLKN
ncbi:MAG: hypothetical protein RI935_754 [Candidatus Parcubacteria bacterium]|jgi:HAD superfamily hydrolase (TIGR01509 family)